MLGWHRCLARVYCGRPTCVTAALRGGVVQSADRREHFRAAQGDAKHAGTAHTGSLNGPVSQSAVQTHRMRLVWSCAALTKLDDVRLRSGGGSHTVCSHGAFTDSLTGHSGNRLVLGSSPSQLTFTLWGGVVALAQEYVIDNMQLLNVSDCTYLS